MLSHLYRLVTQLRHELGFLSILQQMNSDHYQQLLQKLAGMKNDQGMTRFLMMDILISTEAAPADISCPEPRHSEDTLAM
jgi:hypothetical protein